MFTEKHDTLRNIIKRFQNLTLNSTCCHKRIKCLRPSAFRAVNNSTQQSVAADIPVVPVMYPNQVFDLNNEYDPVCSTFTPKQDGIYSVIASVDFYPDITQVNHRVLISIQINGNPVVVDNDFFGEITFRNVTSVSAILQLTAGDAVNVSAVSSTNGFLTDVPLGMHFEAARLPSPLINDPSTTIITSSSSIFSGRDL
ncbi:hypothetical protein [Desulfosporosinus nitroreducens]|uniref:hypothetical protein n=1 Tax=Desulfosporosinus nitroreducens TaxID=2018668 RepID=UPI00207C4260|nr:hypothetical protein [Desulfosporosinus nitroreducens]MCO1602809.1 hypothetical protein [Desulfosporosinus nitroreducens]